MVRKPRVINWAGLIWTIMAVALGGFATPASAASRGIMALPDMVPRTEDLDGMVKRRAFRILVPLDRTAFFLDKGTSGGIEAELGREFKSWINKKYGNKKTKIHVGFVPTRREELLSALKDGKGDIAAGTLTITPERKALVDFSEPLVSGVKEVLITGPASPEVKSLDDLAGKAITVRSRAATTPTSPPSTKRARRPASRCCRSKPPTKISRTKICWKWSAPDYCRGR